MVYWWYMYLAAIMTMSMMSYGEDGCERSNDFLFLL